MAKARKKARPEGEQLIESNKKARFDYEVVEELEAGVVLQGSEVKSIRDGRVSLREAYCRFVRGELFLEQAHVGEYVQAHGRNHLPVRPRKLLLHARQLRKWEDAVKRDGMTIVPLEVYVKERHIKVRVGLARGKKVHDKRASIKAREQDREMQRALRQRD